jgi:hypothetical protein
VSRLPWQYRGRAVRSVAASQAAPAAGWRSFLCEAAPSKINVLCCHPVPLCASAFGAARRREATGQGGGPVTEAAVERLADEDFLKELRGGMLRFAQLQLRDEQLAEDLVQDALVSAMAGAKGFAGRAALGTWVLSILRNKISDSSPSTSASYLSLDG